MADPNDPKGLIREAYRIDGIGPEECRSIFLDWALSLPDEAVPDAAIAALLEMYGQAAPDHPMTRVLGEGLAGSGTPVRRGGRAGRFDRH